jgi:hypothetical protein
LTTDDDCVYVDTSEILANIFTYTIVCNICFFSKTLLISYLLTLKFLIC